MQNKYYHLKKGEIIQEGDECGIMANYNDSEYKWEKDTICVGQPAPDPQFMSHRQYRRLIRPHFSLETKLMALSWKQPFAQLMLHGKIETRTWPTNYRGLVLICASKTPYTYDELHRISGKSSHSQRAFKALMNNDVDTTKSIFDYCTFGHAIAIAQLVDCRIMTPEDEEKCFVDFQPGLWCHVYENVKPIKPLEWIGKQGWSQVPDYYKDAIRFI